MLTPSLSFNTIMSVLIVVAARIRHQDLQQIEQQTQDLSEAVRQAEMANKLKDHFLANMSHELRTPLNAIIGFTEVTLMGLTGEITAETRRASERIHFNSERLLQLIDDILDISKIEAGRVEILSQPFSPSEILSGLELSLKPQATGKSLAFITELDPQLPPMLIGDAKRLEQILINLTSNAVKFTEKGSVSVILRRLSAEEWAIMVSDTGIGIPPHSLETIFEKFRQVDGSSRRAYGGSGLGLAIVRELALLMNGNIKVKSPPGVGSTFTVTLPLVVEEGAKS
jgi:signal transduction histidine kinase